MLFFLLISTFTFAGDFKLVKMADATVKIPRDVSLDVVSGEHFDSYVFKKNNKNILFASVGSFPILTSMKIPDKTIDFPFTNYPKDSLKTWDCEENKCMYTNLFFPDYDGDYTISFWYDGNNEDDYKIANNIVKSYNGSKQLPVNLVETSEVSKKYQMIDGFSVDLPAFSKAQRIYSNRDNIAEYTIYNAPLSNGENSNIVKIVYSKNDKSIKSEFPFENKNIMIAIPFFKNLKKRFSGTIANANYSNGLYKFFVVIPGVEYNVYIFTAFNSFNNAGVILSVINSLEKNNF